MTTQKLNNKYFLEDSNQASDNSSKSDSNITVIIKKILRNGTEGVKELSEFKQMCEYYKEIDNVEYYPISYAIYELGFDSKTEEIENCVNSLIDAIEKTVDELEDSQHIHRLIKIKDHLLLANQQYSYFHQIEEQGKKFDEFNSKMNSEEEKLKAVQKSQNSIYTSFIAILGLFSSMIFALFGGFKSAVDISNHASEFSHIICSVSSIGIVMVCVVFVFLRILQRVYSATDPLTPIVQDTKAKFKDKIVATIAQLAKVYPEFFWSVCALLILLLIGIILKVFRL